MADEGRDFKINFTADASQAVAASQEVAAAVGKVADTTDKTATNTKKLTNDTTEATEATHKHKSAHGELHKAMRVIEEQAPELGVLLKTALSPAGGSILAIIAIYQHFNAELEETNRKLDEMGASAAKGFGNMRESAREAGDAIAANQRSIKQWSEDLGKSSGEVVRMIGDEIAALNAETEATDKLLLARANLAKAQIDERVRSGQMSDAQGILQKATIDQRTQHDVSANQEARLNKEWEIKAQALRDVAAQGVGYASGFDSLTAARDDKGRATLIQELPKWVKDLTEGAAETDKWQKEAQARADAQNEAAHRMDVAHATIGMGTEDSVKESRNRANEMQAEADALALKRDKEKEAAEKARTRLEELTAVQEDWNHKVEQGKRELEENKQVFEQLSAELEHLRLQRAGAPVRAEVQAIQDQAAGVKTFGDVAGTDFGKMLYGADGGAADAAWKKLHGQQPGAAENDQLQMLMKFLGANNGNSKKILEVIASAHESVAGQQAAIAMLLARMQEMAKEVNILRGQVKNARNNVGG